MGVLMWADSVGVMICMYVGVLLLCGHVYLSFLAAAIEFLPTAWFVIAPPLT